MPDFRLPDLGEGLTEAQVISWLVEVGDEVTVDQPVAMAYLPVDHAILAHEVYAEVRGKRLPMRVSAMPFAPHRYFRG